MSLLASAISPSSADIISSTEIVFSVQVYTYVPDSGQPPRWGQGVSLVLFGVRASASPNMAAPGLGSDSPCWTEIFVTTGATAHTRGQNARRALPSLKVSGLTSTFSFGRERPVKFYCD